MFTVKINGRPIAQFSGTRVNRVALQTNEGEAGAVRVAPDQSEVNLLIDFANPADFNLIDMEALQRPKNVTAEMALFPPVQENTMIHAPLTSTEGTTRSGLQLSSEDASFPPIPTFESNVDSNDENEDEDSQLRLPEFPPTPSSTNED